MFTQRIFALALAALGVGEHTGGLAIAETYPSKPIKLIVPFSAGGQPDIMARLIAPHLSSTLGPVIVDNRPGAGGTIGARAVASAEPDGHTLLLGTTGVLAISPAYFKNPGYHPIKSFAPTAMLSEVPFVLVVAPAVPAKIVGDLVAYAKANPGKLSFGASTGTPPHLACERLKAATAADIVHVSYTASMPAMTDLMGGQIHIICEATSFLLPFIQAGKVRPLAVMTTARLPELPNVPTMIETGLSDVLVSVWAGVLAPAGTPESIISMLNTKINEGLKSSEVQASLARLGAKPRVGSPQEFASFIGAEIRKWAEMVKLSGAKMD